MNSTARILLLAFVTAFVTASVLAGSPRPPRGDERVEFYPTLGHRVDGGWEVEVHGRLFEPERRRLTVDGLREITGLALDGMTPEEERVFADRARLFLADNERGERLALRAGSKSFVSLPTGEDGHFTSKLRLTEADVRQGGQRAASGHPLRVEVDDRRPGARPYAGWIHLVEPEGVSVISDLDDTIKITQVRDRREMLRNTFCRPFAAVPGMAEVYRGWGSQTNTAFHYVSAGPWALHEPLADFLESSGFPAGSLHLKRVRWKDRTALDLFAAPDAHKRAEIEKLLKRHPDRVFVLVGDSGERDPEIYGDLARRHPRQIRQIFIRDVTGEGTDAARYREAFQELPAAHRRVFKEPTELPSFLREIEPKSVVSPR